MLLFINKDSTSSNVARSTPSERRLINEQSREHRASAKRIAARSHARQQNQPKEASPDYTFIQATTPRQRQSSEASSDHTSDQATTYTDSDTGSISDNSDTSDTSDASDANDSTNICAERPTVITVPQPHATTTKSSTKVSAPASIAKSASKEPAPAGVAKSSSKESAHANTAKPYSKPSVASKTSRVTSNTPRRLPQTKPMLIALLGNSFDPFQATDAPLTPSTLHLIQYYKSVYFTAIWTAVHETLRRLLPQGDGIFPCAPEKVIRDALYDRHRMSCLLASTGSHMTMIKSNNLGSNSPSLEVTNLALLQRGTTSLREMLAKERNPSNDILMSSMHLYLAASRMGRAGNAYAHLRGIRALVEGIMNKGEEISDANMGVMVLVDGELALNLLMMRAWKIQDAYTDTVPTSEAARVVEVR